MSISQTSVSSIRPSQESNSSLVFLPDIDTVSCTQARCFVCGSSAQRSVITDEAVRQVWSQKRIFLSKTLRTCPGHIEEKMFTQAALLMIRSSAKGIRLSPEEICQWIHDLSSPAPQTPRVDFTGNTILEDEYPTLVRVSKPEFEEIHSLIKPYMRNTSQRTTRNALGVFLMTMRQNLNQKFLAFLFRTNQPNISEIISTVSTLLDRHFTPLHLGYQHLSREEAIARETPTIFNDILGEPDSLKLVADATYLDIEKPGDFTEQRRTYCLPKKKNLIKPMMLVFGSGYILEAEGPFYSDHRNNDAKILEYIMKKQDSGLASYLKCGDQIIVDRGFRDVEGLLQDVGLEVLMPNLLQGEGRVQFSTLQANESRKVTALRWIVETTNGDIKKMFPFFSGKIESPYKPVVHRFFRICCAMYNAFGRRHFTNSASHPARAQRILSRQAQPNLLQDLVAEKGYDNTTRSLIWRVADKDTFVDFPELELEEIEELTLGPYQILMASYYIKQHMQETGDFQLYVLVEEPNIIRAKIHSRFSGTDKHNVWVQYNAGELGIASIIGYYCQCKTGARTAGTCSHVTAVISQYLDLR